MIIDLNQIGKVYIACGRTDLRKSIDGLSAIVEKRFKLNAFGNNLYLFCGTDKSKMKVLYWDGDGFLLLYKRLENGRFKWPKDEIEVRELSTSELKEKLYSLKEQLFELRRKKAVGALERGEDVIGVRRDIARINLVLRERELSEGK